MDLIIMLVQYQVSMAKQKFKITNRPNYNNALRQRASLTVWLDESAVTAWTDNSSPERRGRPFHYTDTAITTVLMMKFCRYANHLGGDYSSFRPQGFQQCIQLFKRSAELRFGFPS